MNDKKGVVTESRRVFAAAQPEVQNLAKRILQSEREVMHMKRRSDIHERIIQHVKEVIK